MIYNETKEIKKMYNYIKYLGNNNNNKIRLK